MDRTNHGRLAVLVLGQDAVEWLHSGPNGQQSFATEPVLGNGPRAMVEAAERALTTAGSARRTCVLALGPSLVKQRIVTLPELPRADARRVLLRKAASLLECEPHDVLFQAIEVGAEAANRGAAPAKNAEAGAKPERRWLVAAVRRRELSALRYGLRRAGIRVRRTVSLQLSGLARAQTLRSDLAPACIVVSAMRRSVSVSLVQGETIVNENVLEGDIRTQHSLAMSLIQEIKSYDAAWRKGNRGDAVGQVVLLGLPVDRAPLFKAAVQAALPSATVLGESDQRAAASVQPDVVPAAEGTEVREALAREVPAATPSADSGRIEMLVAALEPGRFQLDLMLPIPARTSTVAVVLSALFALFASVGTVAYRSTSRREAEVLKAVRELDAKSVDLEDLRTVNDRIHARLEALRALTRRNGEVLQQGWPLSEVLSNTLCAFGKDAALMSMTLDRPAGAAHITLDGVTAPNPIEAMLRVDRVVQSLEACARFERVVATPGGTLSDGAHPIPFTLTADFEATP